VLPGHSRYVCFESATILTYHYGGWLWSHVEGQPCDGTFEWIEVVW